MTAPHAAAPRRMGEARGENSRQTVNRSRGMWPVLSASAFVVVIGCAVYGSSRGLSTPISDVILPLEDMPSSAGISKQTQRLIVDAVKGETISAKPNKETIDENTVKLINKAVVEAVHTAEGAVKRDVQNEVKAAVKEAMGDVLGSKLTGGEAQQAIKVMTQMPGEAETDKSARAKVQEGKEYDEDLNHITSELTKQLGGLLQTDLKISPGRIMHSLKQQQSQSAHAEHKRTQQVANLVQAAEASPPSSHSRARTSSDEASNSARNVEARKAAEVMSMQEEHAAAKEQREHRASADAKQALLQLVKTAAKQEPPVGLNGQPSRQTAETTASAETTLADANGKKVPISSKHDPAYVHAEEDRDLQAQAYLKKLEKAKAAALAAKNKKHKQAQGSGSTPGGKRKRVDRNAIAEKYLAVMEKQALKQHPTQQEREDRALRSAAHVDEREDRTLLAQKYLKELKKEDKSKAAASESAPKGSRHDSKYLRAQGLRDKQAAEDMALLKKSEAVIHKGNMVLKVHLSKSAVVGVDKLALEKQELTRPKTDRTKIAESMLKKLKPLMNKYNKDHVGKYFHKDAIPEAIRKPLKLHLDKKAMNDLKQLKRLEKHPQLHLANVDDRNVIALEDLKKLESKTGKLPHAAHLNGGTSPGLSADALAQRDLKLTGYKQKQASDKAAAIVKRLSQEKLPSTAAIVKRLSREKLPVDKAALAGHSQTALSMIAKDLNKR